MQKMVKPNEKNDGTLSKNAQKLLEQRRKRVRELEDQISGLLK